MHWVFGAIAVQFLYILPVLRYLNRIRGNSEKKSWLIGGPRPPRPSSKYATGQSISQHTCMLSVQPSMSGCIFCPVYSIQELYINSDCIGVTQLVVAISSVMPLSVGHVALGCSPSGPGISPSSTGGIASSGSRSPSCDDVSRFFLKHQNNMRL